MQNRMLYEKIDLVAEEMRLNPFFEHFLQHDCNLLLLPPQKSIYGGKLKRYQQVIGI